jgi:hypothetical protein
MDDRELKTATLNLRIEPAIKRAIEQAARAERRSVTSYVEMLVIPHLRAGGYLPDDRKPKRARST